MSKYTPTQPQSPNHNPFGAELRLYFTSLTALAAAPRNQNNRPATNDPASQHDIYISNPSRSQNLSTFSLPSNFLHQLHITSHHITSHHITSHHITSHPPSSNPLIPPPLTRTPKKNKPQNPISSSPHAAISSHIITLSLPPPRTPTHLPTYLTYIQTSVRQPSAIK
ncbi:uncharacterized protein LY89DRAFT_196433 [Mollisia scopiformis]|uniref:Uncharacterized protein n=1 Tax=Mollisia scopiformis TaxID=149040 RepID=A0A194WY81_MOLSC|nr:uncharacterized protein LY89DRAFT_196433 [Mollisia scopiformis]KUJ12890.1 hypothetical protein LY89DRAFT_196433 [Mollisia scopiformis]